MRTVVAGQRIPGSSAACVLCVNSTDDGAVRVLLANNGEGRGDRRRDALDSVKQQASALHGYPHRLRYIHTFRIR